VPYITSVEEIGFERGQRSLILLLLEQRVGQLPDDVRDHISQLHLTQLEALAIALLNFFTLAELEAWLGSHQK
jgi:uncharacterized protein involved in cysteine biosynthesis